MTTPTEAVDCQRCPLADERTHVVWGNGPTHADIMILGEAHGYYEDKDGSPFVGKTGEVLGDMLALAGLERRDVYISYRVKCRPPKNRDPLPNEHAACLSWLEQELSTVRPKVVIMVGLAAASLAFPGMKMRDIRRTSRAMKVGDITSLFIATYHPAATFRQGQQVYNLIVDDIKYVKEVLLNA